MCRRCRIADGYVVCFYRRHGPVIRILLAMKNVSTMLSLFLRVLDIRILLVVKNVIPIAQGCFGGQQ